VIWSSVNTWSNPSCCDSELNRHTIFSTICISSRHHLSLITTTTISFLHILYPIVTTPIWQLWLTDYRKVEHDGSYSTAALRSYGSQKTHTPESNGCPHSYAHTVFLVDITFPPPLKSIQLIYSLRPSPLHYFPDFACLHLYIFTGSSPFVIFLNASRVNVALAYWRASFVYTLIVDSMSFLLSTPLPGL